jgi:threonine synthase
MKYVSTRSPRLMATLTDAIERGLAPDGGLYVPAQLPDTRANELTERLNRVAASLPALATQLLEPFFQGDALAPWLAQISAQALTFPTPLKHLSGETAVLELFHGPTAAFKDVGARFLAGCFASMPLRDSEQPGQPRHKTRTILVATSGDTGGAVASAFHSKPGVEVAILFPEGGVSPLQEKQLTCWQGNIRSFRVRGSFDDCQRLVKEAFAARATPDEISDRHLTSANSINIGRLLPQMVYYAQASLAYQAMTGERAGFVIPTGNAGNALAAVWAMRLGLPIRELVLASNANRVLPDYFSTGTFKPAPSIKTLANAMDVGNPSNLERLIYLERGDASFKSRIRAVSVSDDRIRETITQGPGRYGEIWCPHTAAAVHARELQNSAHWIIVATAHPAKFGEVVEPLLGHPAPMPPQLAQLLARPSRSTALDARYADLRKALSLD